MTVASTGQSAGALTAALIFSLGFNVFAPVADDAATTGPDHGPAGRSGAATNYHTVPYAQITKAFTAGTQPYELSAGVSWQNSLVAALEAEQLLAAYRGRVLTEDNLDDFESACVIFVAQYGVAGISALEKRLLRGGVEETDALARRYLRALGTRHDEVADREAMRLLLSELGSSSAGRRSAAASALGTFPNALVLSVMERRKKTEKNRMVLATLDAHIRNIRSNGTSSTKAA